MSRSSTKTCRSGLLLASVILAAGASAQTVNLNCGGGDMVTADGTHWSGDNYYTGGDLLYTGYSIANVNPQDLYLYRSARAGLYGDFSYTIPVPNGAYTVTLKMAEIQYSNKGERVFNVAINGASVLSNFDILAHVATLTPFDQQFPVTVTNGAVRIDVQGVVRRGILNGIQIAPSGSTTPPPAQPALSLSTSALSFSGTAGSSNPAAQSISVNNSGTGTMTWTASSNQTWLAVSPNSGSGAGAISVQPNLSGLAAGTYTGSVTVTAAGAAGSPQSVGVTLVVAPAPQPSLSLSTIAISFSGTAGSSNPAAQGISVSNAGTGTLTWTAASNQTWLAISPNSGTGAGTISVQPNLSGLAAGTYTGSVTVTAAGATGSPKSVAVTLVVSAAPTQSVFNINCGGGDFTTADGTHWTADQYYTGGDVFYTGYSIATVNPQDLYLYRSARYGLYGDFSYAIPMANGSYTVTLRFAELQYSNRGDRVFNVAINGNTVLNNFDILASVAPLTPLTQQFTANVTNGVLKIDVTGVVRRGILNAIQVGSSSSQPIVPASLSLGGTTANFSGTQGGSNPSAQSISVANGGGSTLTWSASSNQSWLTVSPSSGTAPGALSLQPNLSGLAAGNYTAAVTVSAPGVANAPQTITVNLTVAAAPPVLTVSSSSMSFSGTAGGSNPASQTANVSNTGGGSLSWTAASNQTWLSVSPALGTNSGVLTVAANLAGLTAGSYSGSITVSGAGTTKTIGVTLAVAAVTPLTMAAAPNLVSLSATTGSNATAQTVSISSTPTSSGWTATKTKPWLTLSQSSGAGAASISLGTQTSGMTAGTYTDTVTIAPTSSGNAATVSVTLTISDPVTPPTGGTGHSWYVSTAGTSSGNGSMNNPWDIQTALTNRGVVQPGDTIWIRGGRYGGGQANSVITSSLVGTASAPIIVRAYPKERAIVDAWLEVGCCDQANNPAAGSYTWFWGLEFAGYNTNRTSGTSGPPEWAAQFNHNGVDTWGAGTKLINCIIHDTGGGISMWLADNSEANGNIVYNVGGYGTDRGHGHNFYIQNVAPAKTLLNDNIGFNNFDMGIQAYGGGSTAWVQNMELRGNIIFNSGILYGQLVDNVTIGGGINGPTGIVLDSNYLYDTPSLGQGYNELGFLWTPRAGTVSATNNYFLGGKQAIDLERWDNVTFTGNTVYSATQDETMLINTYGQSPSGYNYGSNRYFGTGQFTIDSACDNWPCPTTQVVNFASWMALTGLDRNSTFTPGAPTGVWTAVRPNTYEPGRANIVIMNWDLKPGVAVDLSNSGIKVGDSYQIRDAQNWFGGAIVSGVYNGSPVTIPMTGLVVAQPVGSVPNPPVHTAPQFGTFVLLSGNALNVF